MARRLLLDASEFVISCGTVTFDLRESEVLLIRCCTKNECMLPKGRKNVGETLEAAALRETWEETGYSATLLPLPTCTQATPHSTSDGMSLTNTEPIYMSQRNSNGVYKVIFWYAATGDSTAHEQRRPQQPNEDFETKWTPCREAEAALSFDDDCQIFQTAWEAVKMATSA